jgi:CMP-N,N'-diacetyllegionaminic acid synthase
MRILAVIAARGGSKRLPGKNIRVLGGRPLLAWSVQAARGIDDICDILLSTDDHDVARVGKDSGALVPWLRPAELATDAASSVDVCLHALDRYEADRGAVDAILLLQPTSPFRKRTSVLHGIELFKQDPSRPVVSVSPAASHPQWCFRLEQGTLRPFLDSNGLNLRSQDLTPAYVINGAFYLIEAARLREQRSLLGDEMVALLMESPAERIDIDSESDWQAAESMLAAWRT